MIDPLGQGLIHIVADGPAIRRSLDFMLRTAGYQTERWSCTATFLKEANQDIPACTLLDAKLAEAKCLTAFDTLIAAGFHSPVIILSNNANICSATIWARERDNQDENPVCRGRRRA